MKKLQKRFFFLFLIGTLSSFFIACERDYVFQKMEPIEEETWNYKDTVTIEFEVKDTSSPNNFYLKVRNNTDYPYRNLYLFLDLEFPNGKHWLDTAECRLADKKGNWTGRGIGDVKDHEYLFIHRKRLPVEGKHRFHIVHAMRKENLPGVENVGLAIERVPEEAR